MTDKTPAEALLIDRQGDRLTIHRYDDGLYVDVEQPRLNSAVPAAGPFTAAELRSAIAAVHPAEDALLRETEVARDKARADLEHRTRQRDAARNRAGRLQRELTAEQARSQELLDRARAAEREVVTLKRDLQETEQARDNARRRLEEQQQAASVLLERLEEQLAQRTVERDELQQAVTELAQGGEATVEERAAQRPQPRTREDVTDREVEVVMRAMGWWQEGKRIGQYPVNLVRSARRAVADLANLPTQERAEVDAIRVWLQDLDAPVTGLARELYARGFTAPGGES